MAKCNRRYDPWEHRLVAIGKLIGIVGATIVSIIVALNGMK